MWGGLEEEATDLSLFRFWSSLTSLPPSRPFNKLSQHFSPRAEQQLAPRKIPEGSGGDNGHCGPAASESEWPE